MTEKQVRELFAKWQKRLGLSHWEIALEFVDGIVQANEFGCHMKVHRSTYYDRACIQVGNTCLDASKIPDSIEKDLIKHNAITHEEFTEVSVVHELLHLTFRDIMTASDLVREDIHPTTRNVWDEAFKHAEEQTVERLATALVRNWS